MITNALIALVEVLVSPINSLLPDLHLPSWLTSLAFSSGVASELGGPLGAVRSLLPVDTVLTLLQGVLDLWGVIGLFLVFSWIWKHIPTIAGFGTGNG